MERIISINVDTDRLGMARVILCEDGLISGVLLRWTSHDDHDTFTNRVRRAFANGASMWTITEQNELIGLMNDGFLAHDDAKQLIVDEQFGEVRLMSSTIDASGNMYDVAQCRDLESTLATA